MKRLFKFLLILSSVIFFIQAAYGSTHCFKDTICIETIHDNGFVEFQIENMKAFDATITFTINAKNMGLPAQLPYTETISGKSRLTMFRIPIIDKNKKSKYNYHVNWTKGSIYAKHDDLYVYRLPYTAGSFYRITQNSNELFSHSESSRHAVDFAMPEATPLYAAREGRVVDVISFNDIGGPTQDFVDYSNHIIIQHSDGTTGEYHHLMKDGAEVSIGESVIKGQLIGYSGNTGYSTNPHLHFGVYRSSDGNERISIPVKFNSTQGIISSPVKDNIYIAD